MLRTSIYKFKRFNRLFASALMVFSGVFFLPSDAETGDLKLPDLGGSFSSLITPSQEYALGQQWLKAFRSQAPTSSDPFVIDYTERLINKLAVHSDLANPRLDVVVVDIPTINAFAVPGGVVGVNTGLFLYAETEHQIASVLAHELAHLSQRHYARNVEEQKQNTFYTVAGLLASLLIAASSSNSDAGIAAISATQALAIDARLRFSRGMEQEADRLGMATLVRANMNPYGMPEMFEHILERSQFSQRPPEFLLTHPLTESRIADSQNRAQKFPYRAYPKDEHFELVKVRLLVNNTTNPTALIQTFKRELDGNKYSRIAATYAIALAQIKARNAPSALDTLKPLLTAYPNNTFFAVAAAESLALKGETKKALALLDARLITEPNNHPLNVKKAELLMQVGEHEQGAILLQQHVIRRPKDDYVWYLLAEVEGLQGNILGVHLARAEYFSLVGNYSKARIQLEHAVELIDDKDQLTLAKVEQKLRSVRTAQRNQAF